MPSSSLILLMRNLWTCYAGLILRRSLRCLFFYSSGKKTNKLTFFIVRQCGKQCNDLVIQIRGHFFRLLSDPVPCLIGTKVSIA